MHFCLSTQVDTINQARGKIFVDPCSLTQRTQVQFFRHMRKGGERALLDSSLHLKNGSDLGFFSPQQLTLPGYIT